MIVSRSNGLILACIGIALAEPVIRAESEDNKLSGSYRIKVKQSGRFLHVHAGQGGDHLASTRFQTDDDFSTFILKHVGTDFYAIYLKATNASLRVADTISGDKAASTRLFYSDGREDPLDRYGRFLLKRQTDGSYRLRLLTGSWLRVDGYGDKVLRAEKDVIQDGYDRFELVKASTQQALMSSKRVSVTLKNPTPFPAQLEQLNASGQPVESVTCRSGQALKDTRDVGSLWRCTIGTKQSFFTIGDQPDQTIVLGKTRKTMPDDSVSPGMVLVSIENPAPFPAILERLEKNGKWASAGTCQPGETITEQRVVGDRWRCTIGTSQSIFVIGEQPNQTIILGKTMEAMPDNSASHETVLVSIENPAPFPATLERLDENGKWVSAGICQPGETITEQRMVGDHWRCTIGTQQTNFVIQDLPGQTIQLGKNNTPSND